MWSSIDETISDGSLGLNSNRNPKALIVGTCSKDIEYPISLGKSSMVEELLGLGDMPSRIKDMQMTMSDSSIIAIKSHGDIPGTISEIKKTGDVDISILGDPLISARISLQLKNIDDIKVNKSLANNASIGCILKIEGDYTYYSDTEFFVNSSLYIPQIGLEITLNTLENISSNCSWEFFITAPRSSYLELEKVIINNIDIYSPEFIYIAQNIDKDCVKLLGTLSERLFDEHKPCFFLLESGLDNTSERSLSEKISIKREEFTDIAYRFISIVCQEGYILSSSGKVKRSPSGLCAGHITNASVSESIGATNKFPITQYEFISGWTNEHSRALDESRFITLRTYAGLENLFWSNGRTFGGNASDYQFIEIVRTVLKAIRISRKASISYIQSPGDYIGIQNLLADIRSALTTMTSAIPKELDDFIVSFPEGQDINNNGIWIDIELMGLPIIRKIKLNFLYKYKEA